MKKILSINRAAAALVAVVAMTLGGCETFDEPPNTYLASVSIANRTMDQVESAVTSVFTVRGFDGGKTGPEQFTFTRIGSKADQLAYGSYLFKETVNVKVVVTTAAQPDGTILVGCNAWLVETSPDAVFEDSHKVRQLRQRPYEELMEAVKAQSALQ